MAHDAPPGTPELDDRTIETAIALDIDPFAEDHLLWIARSALNDTELPEGWHRCTLPDLTEGFANPSGGIEQQEHPRAEEFRVVVAQERRRLAMKAHRPLQETQPRPAKRARPGTTSGDEENVYKENDKENGKGGIDTRIAAMEASHRVALKGLQRKIEQLRRTLKEKEGAWEHERGRWEAETRRVASETAEMERAKLEDERRSMRGEIRRAVEQERRAAAEEATKAVKTSLRSVRLRRLRSPGVKSWRLSRWTRAGSPRGRRYSARCSPPRVRSSVKRTRRSRRCRENWRRSRVR